MTTRTGSEGFTLVETLASLTLIGLLSLLLETGAVAGRQRLARFEQASAGETVEAAEGLLRARLERSYPAAHLYGVNPTIDFTGMPDQLNFIAPPRDAAGPDMLRHYQLTLAPNGDLQLNSVSDLANDPTQPSERLVLLRGVASLDLAYYGVLANDRVPAWRARWESQALLPSLVRVRVAFAPGDPRQWPSLVVRPAATLDSACIIDPNTSRCRGRS